MARNNNGENYDADERANSQDCFRAQRELRGCGWTGLVACVRFSLGLFAGFALGGFLFPLSFLLSLTPHSLLGFPANHLFERQLACSVFASSLCCVIAGSLFSFFASFSIRGFFLALSFYLLLALLALFGLAARGLGFSSFARRLFASFLFGFFARPSISCLACISLRFFNRSALCRFLFARNFFPALLLFQCCQTFGFGFAGLPRGLTNRVAFGGFVEDRLVRVLDAKVVEQRVEPRVVQAKVNVLLALRRSGDQSM